MKGTVKFYNPTKGFGFITGEDGKEYFVHQTGLAEGANLQENDQVAFDVEEGDRGPKAVNVAKDDEAAPVEESEEASEEEASEEPAEEASEEAPAEEASEETTEE
jgi:cold shock protein